MDLRHLIPDKMGYPVYKVYRVSIHTYIHLKSPCVWGARGWGEIRQNTFLGESLCHSPNIACPHILYITRRRQSIFCGKAKNLFISLKAKHFVIPSELLGGNFSKIVVSIDLFLINRMNNSYYH